MPCFGGYAPFPLRLGESRTPVKDINRALNSSRGTALDTTELASPVWVENHAIARAIADVWATNERVSLQTDLSRTALLARWEAMFGIVPYPGQTDRERRNVLSAIQRRAGIAAIRKEIVDLLTPALSPISFELVTLNYTDSSVISSSFASWYLSSSSTSAGSMYLRGAVSEDVLVQVIVGAYNSSLGGYSLTVTTTSNSIGVQSVTFVNTGDYLIPNTTLTLSYLGGLVQGDYYYGVATKNGFTSSVAELTVAVSVPSWMSNAEYYEKISKVYGLLSDLIPAWVNVHVARDYSVAGSFILSDDATPNLDNQRLSA